MSMKLFGFVLVAWLLACGCSSGATSVNAQAPPATSRWLGTGISSADGKTYSFGVEAQLASGFSSLDLPFDLPAGVRPTTLEAYLAFRPDCRGQALGAIRVGGEDGWHFISKSNNNGDPVNELIQFTIPQSITTKPGVVFHVEADPVCSGGTWELQGMFRVE